MNQEDSNDKTTPYKLVLLGDSAVGKSSLVLRFVRGEFSEFQESTIGAAFLTQTIPLDDDNTIKFDIWDTAGQERYKSLAPMYYRGAPAAVVVYDITNSESFNKAKYWVSELQKQDTPVVIALAGNKCDLAEQRKVDTSEAQLYADEKGLILMETSAKTAQNVNEIFVQIAKKLPKIDKEKVDNIEGIIPKPVSESKKCKC